MSNPTVRFKAKSLRRVPLIRVSRRMWLQIGLANLHNYSRLITRRMKPLEACFSLRLLQAPFSPYLL